MAMISAAFRWSGQGELAATTILISFAGFDQGSVIVPAAMMTAFAARLTTPVPTHRGACFLADGETISRHTAKRDG